MKAKLSILTMLLLMLMATPALGAVNFDVNGRNYDPATTPVLEQGITSGSAQMLARTLGASLTLDEDSITLTENENTLQMTVGNQTAKFNGEERTMPRAPERVADGVLLPVRFVYESFGATVDWVGEEQTVTVSYEETRNNMTAEQMLAESSRLMQKANTYKMDVDINADTHMDMQSAEETEAMATNMTGTLQASVQYNPILMYMVQNMNITMPELADEPQEIQTQTVINENGFFMTMPEIGWVKMEIPGMDLNALMKQSMAQDPLASIQQMKDTGMAVSFANDEERDGQKYWVIDVTMGADSLQQYIESMGQVPGLDQSIADMYKDLNLDMKYTTWINQKTLYTDVMDLTARYSFGMDVPVEETTGHLDMDIDMNAIYSLYDFGASFDVPDVSNARAFDEVMQEEIEE
ncbi:MAG: copper amine oxidase N-terminal domain-containing protein [Bacillota bacterium]|nr:copper amine oxidase N-terminal domain-containing protein [Bacillota bacterium]